MSSNGLQFPAVSRFLHWLMALLIILMLFIGAGMAGSTSSRYGLLVSLHKPIGIAIFLLVMVRVVNRLINRPPPLPETLPLAQRLGAQLSHLLLYILMFVLPLVGWGMLSAAGYPIVLFGPVQLPPILPKNPGLYANLRALHSILAYLLFLTFLIHLAAALFHGLIRQDGVFSSMASWRKRI